MRRPESIPEKLWRYRGVLLVAAVPVILIVAIIALVPRSAPIVAEHAHTVGELQHSFVYSIVLDAGSTGSRIHVFKFSKQGSSFNLISDEFKQTKPGLSAYKDDPKAAADSLKVLMDVAMATVPKEQQASTSLSLKATAGLRLLPGTKAQDILEAVKAFFADYPFKVKSNAVAILDGKDEGAFAWLTLNYLLGKLGADIGTTVAAIDMGGGSIQEAFAVSDAEAKAAPAGYVTTLHGNGATYNVYVHSYLGYGLMAGRAKVIAASGADNACFPKSHSGSYSYGDKQYEVKAAETAGSFDKCAATVDAALDHKATCGAEQDLCSFAGGWRGKASSSARVYYVSSYFWDRATDSGIIADKAAIEWATTPKDFASKAGAVCGKDMDALKKDYVEVQQAHAPYFCLDLSFCYTMLTKGFKISEETKVTLVKQVKYNGQAIEAAWPLGAAINDLSS